MRIFLTMLVIGLFVWSSQAIASESRGITSISKDADVRPTGEVQLYGKSWAIFIGIDSYEDESIPRLKNAVNDARGVKKILQERYLFDYFYELHDNQATLTKIQELFQDELAEKVKEDDSVFVFWAGHGSQHENTRFGEIGELIPYDGSWKKHSRNISMDTIKSTISKSLKARHIFYVMDACYGGLMANKRSINQSTEHSLEALQQLAKEDVRQVLTAGSKGEQVLDGANGHSIFTNRLIEALGKAGDFITANELQAIITRNVALDALKYDHKQTPQYGKLYGEGDFVFVPSNKSKLSIRKLSLEEYLKNGAEFEKKSDYVSAGKVYTEAISNYKDSDELYVLRSSIYLSNKEFDKTLDDLTTAININKSNKEAFYNRGALWGSLNQNEKAIDDLSKSINIDSTYAPSYCLRGSIYFNLKNTNAALTDLNKCIEYAQNKNVLPYTIRSAIHAYNNDVKHAINDITEAINIKPNSESYLNRSGMYMAFGDYEKAKNDINKAIELNSKDINIYNARAVLYVLTGEYNSAIKDLLYAIQNKDNSFITNFNLAYTYALANDISNAKKYVEKALVREPDNEKAKLLLKSLENK